MSIDSHMQYQTTTHHRSVIRNATVSCSDRPGKNQNLFATLTVRAYVQIVKYWTLQQSTAKSTEREVQQIA